VAARRQRAAQRALATLAWKCLLQREGALSLPPRAALGALAARLMLATASQAAQGGLRAALAVRAARRTVAAAAAATTAAVAGRLVRVRLTAAAAAAGRAT